MRKKVFTELIADHPISSASRLSGYPRSLHYYRPTRRRTARLDTEVLQAIELQVTEHPSYGVRRIAAMLCRAGIQVSRKKVYRIMKLANLVRKRSVRKHMIPKKMLTVPDKPDRLWQQDIYYLYLVWTRWMVLSIQHP
jgi:transposase InsO family protein